MRTNNTTFDIKFNLKEDEFLSAGKTNLVFCHNLIFRFSNMTMFIVRTGYARISVDFKEYYLERNSILNLFGNTTISLLDFSEDFMTDYIIFKLPELVSHGIKLDQKLLEFIKHNPCYNLEFDIARQVIKTFELINIFYQEPVNKNKIRILSNLLQVVLYNMNDKLLDIISKKEAETINTPRQEEIFKHFMGLINKHCINQRDVNFYADKLCITPRYLSSIVTEITKHKTAKKIIDEYVILEIKYLLSSTEIPIKDIVSKLNFPDQSFMGKYFKKHTGMTLKEFRK